MSERHKAAALKRGADRKFMVEQRVDQALNNIAQEMQANGGIYPNNGGAVSMAEIARRAGINESTLYKKDNVDLKDRVALWLDTLKIKETVGRKRARKSYQQRSESWKEKYDALQNRHIRTELELQQLQAELEDLRSNYDTLLKHIQIFRQNKVIPFPKGKQ
jgi:hypothetical protein